jgi:hypothetical protein
LLALRSGRIRSAAGDESTLTRGRSPSIDQFEEPKVSLFLVFTGAMCGLNVAAVVIMLMATG